MSAASRMAVIHRACTRRVAVNGCMEPGAVVLSGSMRRDAANGGSEPEAGVKIDIVRYIELAG